MSNPDDNAATVQNVTLRMDRRITCLEVWPVGVSDKKDRDPAKLLAMVPFQQVSSIRSSPLDNAVVICLWTGMEIKLFFDTDTSRCEVHACLQVFQESASVTPDNASTTSLNGPSDVSGISTDVSP